MNLEANQTPKPAPLTFHEALEHYFAMENELYERKVRDDKDDKSEVTQGMQDIIDALRNDMVRGLPQGDKETFLAAVHEEQNCERWTLWIRRRADKLQASRPGILSLELIGSAGVVVALAYYILRLDAVVALLLGLLLAAVRLVLPRFMLRLAARQERQLRKLRRVREPS